MTFIKKAVLGEARPTVNWKGGVPGNPYISNDVISPSLNEIVMINVENNGIDPAEFVTVNFPEANAASGGATIALANLLDKKAGTPGYFRAVPFSGDSISFGATDEVQIPLDAFIVFGWCRFVSDGNGTWHATSIGGDYLTFPE